MVPRTSSTTIVASTNAENVYAIRPGFDEPAPSASRTAPVTSATPIGHASIRRSDRALAFRQATSGPIPISRSSGSPNARKKKS